MATGTSKGRLGDRLVHKGQLTREQLDVALAEQRRAHRPLGEILIGLGFVGQDDITLLLAEDLGCEFVRAENIQPDPLILSGLDPSFVRATHAFPYALEGGQLKVAMVDPDDPHRVGEVRKRFPYPLKIAITTEKHIQRLLRDHLQTEVNHVAAIIAEIARGVESADFPVERVAEALLLDGVHRGATDIHIEPEEHVTRVRYRFDGILRSGENLPAEHTAAVVSRVKILSNLDISERRRPQDGRLRIHVDGRDVDMRVSVMPCAWGENIVCRILDRAGGALKLAQLGLAPACERVLQLISDRSHGVFLVTGPTGSGKTSTLYAMLGNIDAMTRKVATVEDPIEYRMPLVRQSQVDPTIGYGFQEGLRALLRQDPDAILVGEIRDHETADMCIKAAMTGHLVFSTLHTNSALGAIPRLVDMGIEPFLIGDALIGVLAQRLVRRVCSGCAAQVAANESERKWLGIEVATLNKGSGCERCAGTGYKGRLAMVELFLPDEGLQELLRGKPDPALIERMALEHGFQDMFVDGRRLVLSGATTMEEVLRVNSSHWLTKEEREGL